MGNGATGWTSKDDGFNVLGADEGNPRLAAGTHQKDTYASDGLDGEHDGVTEQDTGSVVYKEIVNKGAYNDPEKWFYNSNDGYYYYTSTLKGGNNNSTVPLLNSVTLCSDTDMGKFNDEQYLIVYDTAKDKIVDTDMNSLLDGTADFGKEGALNKWIKLDPDVQVNNTYLEAHYPDEDLNNLSVFTYKDNELDDSAQGYANADYALNITVEFIQTTEEGEGLAANWDWHPGAVWTEKTGD